MKIIVTIFFLLIFFNGFSQTPLSRLFFNRGDTSIIPPDTCSNPPASDIGTATGVATYECIGLYWNSSGGGSSTTCNVKYRISGGCAWSDGLALVWDSRGLGESDPNQYRGSIVGLTANTTYEIWLTAGSNNNSFNVTTWDDTPPEGTVTTVANRSTRLTITTSGTAGAWRVYQPSGWSAADPWNNRATIDVNDGDDNCVDIDAAYIILRGFNIRDASTDAVLINENAHHVIIEYCDIEGWGAIGMGGNNQGGVRIKGFSYTATNVKQVTVQRNKIHDSRENSNSWDDGGHPLGPNAITFDESGGNHVIRYNSIYTTDTTYKFMDGIGGGDNFTFTGAPGRDSDIYGNDVQDVYDDGIEAEGGGMNVRVWGNWVHNTFTGIATAAVSIGPMYVFRNVYNVSIRSKAGSSASTINNEDRGPFNKNGSGDYPPYGNGRTFLFHNTCLQPTQAGFGSGGGSPRGCGGGPVDNGGSDGVYNVYSRNNIWSTWKPTNANFSSIGEYQPGASSSSGNTYDFDLYNGLLTIVASGSQEANGIHASAIYTVALSTTGVWNPAGYYLTSGSPGYQDAFGLNNFNFGNGLSDIGAQDTNSSPLQFGIYHP